MAEADITSTLVSHLTDAVAMEQNVEQMLGGMISTTADPQIRSRLEEHREETKVQQERLRERLEAHDASESAMKSVAAKAGAAMKGMLDVVRDEKAGRNARDGYATEHVEIAAYELLERVARRAGDEATAAVARQNCAEERAMAQFFEDHWDAVAEQSLREEGVLA